MGGELSKKIIPKLVDKRAIKEQVLGGLICETTLGKKDH
jgi:hypothetical protein